MRLPRRLRRRRDPLDGWTDLAHLLDDDLDEEAGSDAALLGWRGVESGPLIFTLNGISADALALYYGDVVIYDSPPTGRHRKEQPADLPTITGRRYTYWPGLEDFPPFRLPRPAHRKETP